MTSVEEGSRYRLTSPGGITLIAKTVAVAWRFLERGVRPEAPNAGVIPVCQHQRERFHRQRAQFTGSA
jgi:hypothetical protein